MSRSNDNAKSASFATTMRYKIIRTETKLKLLRETYEKIYGNRRTASSTGHQTSFSFDTTAPDTTTRPTFGSSVVATDTSARPTFGSSVSVADAPTFGFDNVYNASETRKKTTSTDDKKTKSTKDTKNT
ncbi:hypothetical protein F-S17_0238 [Faustovirus]|nr:hypothetical protein F-S17_0238 [Faustovirus]